MSSLQESSDNQVNTKENNEQKEKQDNQPNLLDIEITNENVALNVMVMFLNLAQNRGAFRIDESAKIYECIKSFQKNTKSKYYYIILVYY